MTTGKRTSIGMPITGKNANLAQALPCWLQPRVAAGETGKIATTYDVSESLIRHNSAINGAEVEVNCLDFVPDALLTPSQRPQIRGAGPAP